MLRLVFYTAVRVSELCKIEVAEVDLENCKIFVNQGKGSRARHLGFLHAVCNKTDPVRKNAPPQQRVLRGKEHLPPHRPLAP